MEIYSLVLQGAGIAARGPLVSVYLGSGDAYGFAVLVLGVAFKSGGSVPLCNGLFWFSIVHATCRSHLCQGKRAPGWDVTREHGSRKRLSPLCAASQEVPLIVKNH